MQVDTGIATATGAVVALRTLSPPVEPDSSARPKAVAEGGRGVGAGPGTEAVIGALVICPRAEPSVEARAAERAETGRGPIVV